MLPQFSCMILGIRAAHGSHFQTESHEINQNQRHQELGDRRKYQQRRHEDVAQPRGVLFQPNKAPSNTPRINAIVMPTTTNGNVMRPRAMMISITVRG